VKRYREISRDRMYNVYCTGDTGMLKVLVVQEAEALKEAQNVQHVQEIQGVQV
jgi:hypothetical protein